MYRAGAPDAQRAARVPGPPLVKPVWVLHRRGLWLTARYCPGRFPVRPGGARLVCRPRWSRPAANSGGTASLRPSARPAQRHHCARGSISSHPCARHSTHALRCRADAVKGWSAARDAFGGAERSTWNLDRPIAQGPEGAADLGSTGHITRSEQVMSRWVLHQLSRRVRCVLTPWPARAGMLDREGRFEAPIRAELPRLRDGQRF